MRRLLLCAMTRLSERFTGWLDTAVEKDRGSMSPRSSVHYSKLSREPASDEGEIVEYDLRRRGSSLLLQLRGELDMCSRGPLHAALLEALRHPACTDLIADVRGLTFMDSSGLGVFVQAMQTLRTRGGHVHMLGCEPSVRRALSVARLDRVFRLHDSSPENYDAILRDGDPARPSGWTPFRDHSKEGTCTCL